MEMLRMACNLLKQYIFSMHKVLGSIPTTKKKKHPKSYNSLKCSIIYILIKSKNIKTLFQFYQIGHEIMNSTMKKTRLAKSVNIEYGKGKELS